MSDDNTGLVVSPEQAAGLVKYDAAIFDEVSKSSDFLPRLQLYGSNSEMVKNGTIPMAHWGLQHDASRIDDLGKQVDIAVLSWRPKAMRIDKAAGVVSSYFDIRNPEFEKVKAESNTQDSGCMYGPEFLTWLPVKAAFATLYMGSKTARRESPRLLPLIGKAATLNSKLIKGTRFTWHGPTVIACTTPLSVMFDAEELAEQVDKFNNPKESVIEKAEEPVAGEARER
jgi:hypothetical protein